MQYVKCLNFFQDLLKAKALERGRLLGLDVGDKYVGLAVSDLDNKIATPLSVLIRKKTNIDLMASDFQSLAVQVKLFIDDLSKTGKLDGVKYTFWNECFTSKQYMTSSKESHSLSFQQNADLLLKPLSLHPILSKTIVDKFAAVQILQTYLDYGKKNVKLETAG
ncbi:PREDICTED: putative pre-16S rRNA nuclease isoform X3 [Theobroma cacao]|uniref:Polynucleotidyl transferase isoform 6 n=2 Tax=Theobroma cacao TaxID=3641 RepID=A0A061G5Q5_THECC|nr:PREDICTED: putative pre-16S rRNA nuclease isoform X3 [Theobroma cacao]XP_007040214.1 PREDICTED: putative pre-16S rRNA nuclease isoform X3 [Theobroma cacao]EOY24713.1 Polynucleotidyl transferase isoform 6 [Theobroma cacao]EOY24715.1 Polynucleotidyl transferase isoform 6 [Theobroma cacao]